MKELIYMINGKMKIDKTGRIIFTNSGEMRYDTYKDKQKGEIEIMMNMLIKLDEERVLSDEKYDLEDMWQRIDRHFATAFTKKILSDGSAYYECMPKEDYFTEIFLAVSYLEEQNWFAEYCTKWIWYDNDYNEKMPFDPMDILARRRKDNPMFAKYARE